MTTSILMVTYNRLPLTQRMLDSFLKTTTSPYRLMIVDNASTDGTVEWLKQLNIDSANCQGVNIYFNKTNKGFASGLNRGMKMAEQYKDPYLCSMDNDIELPNNWLKDCTDTIDVNPNYVIGVNFEGVSYPPLTKNGRTFQYKSKGNLGCACMVFSRALHEKIGYFTTEYQLYGEEDANWGFRARLAGYNLGYLITPGLHFGSGELDSGEYRAFKDECRKKNIPQFQKDCYDYVNKKKSIFHPFTEKS